jgi:dUTP pyrophosphatase
MQIKVKKLSESAKLPTRGSEKAAGYDLYAHITGHPYENRRIRIPPHGTVKIGTGLSIAIPDGYFGAILARSGLATKQGLRPANAVGVCDSDYRGEYIIAVHNDSDEERFVANGDRIAQLVIIPYLPVEFKEVNTLDGTARGEGGFGSTGTT